jgi:2-polyprenyl-3-methyl-5-hydroxy-6-metoxy-1,4-benzoquinol methylase
MATKEQEQLRRSWVANADSWRDAVREHKIDSRRAATDAAIVDLIVSLRPRNVLDLGCGEGWLARALAAEGINVCGVDASKPLIDAAIELGGGTFFALSYEKLSAGDAPPPFDVAVANFSILDEDVQPIFDAVSHLLRPEGAFVIQTVHPAFAVGESAYESGWRTETFAAIDGEWPEPMPWYFRTLAAWVEAISKNGFTIAEIREPLDREGSRPLSIIFVCRRA